MDTLNPKLMAATKIEPSSMMTLPPNTREAAQPASQ